MRLSIICYIILWLASLVIKNRLEFYCEFSFLELSNLSKPNKVLTVALCKSSLCIPIVVSIIWYKTFVLRWINVTLFFFWFVIRKNLIGPNFFLRLAQKSWIFIYSSDRLFYFWVGKCEKFGLTLCVFRVISYFGQTYFGQTKD